MLENTKFAFKIILSMRIFVIILLILPIFGFGQTKYSSESKKLYSKALKEYKNGNSGEALSLFEQCVASEPRYAEAYLNISSIKFSEKDYISALSNSKKAFFNNQFQPAIYSQLGKCYYKTHSYDSAAYYLEKGIELGSTGSNDLLYLGKSQEKNEEYPEAIANLNKYLTDNPNSLSAYNSRGSVYYNMAEWEKAKADFEKALELNSSSAIIYSNLANVSLELGDSAAALDYMTKGTEHANHSEKVNLLILKGNYLHGSGKIDEAEAIFNEAQSLDADNPVILVNQAAIFLEQDNYESALDKCNQALEIDDEMMEAYYNRGIANEMLRNVVEACSDWEQAFILGSEKAEEFLNSATCNE